MNAFRAALWVSIGATAIASCSSDPVADTDGGVGVGSGGG
jgi:hypothetical protein